MLRGDGLLREVMEGRLNGKKRAGKSRKGMIGDLKQALGQERTRQWSRGNKRKTEKSDGYVEMKRMALTERGGGSGWQEPARGQKTNDDDDDYDDDDDDDGDDANIVLFCCYIDKNTKQQTRFSSLTMLTERSVITIACWTVIIIKKDITSMITTVTGIGTDTGRYRYLGIGTDTDTTDTDADSLNN